MNRILRTIFADKEGKIVLFQWPNAPLIAWAALLVVAKFVHASPLHALLSLLSFVALMAWALLELFLGVTIFRRLLGAVVLVMSVVSRF